MYEFASTQWLPPPHAYRIMFTLGDVHAMALWVLTSCLSFALAAFPWLWRSLGVEDIPGLGGPWGVIAMPDGLNPSITRAGAAASLAPDNVGATAPQDTGGSMGAAATASGRCGRLMQRLRIMLPWWAWGWAGLRGGDYRASIQSPAATEPYGDGSDWDAPTDSTALLRVGRRSTRQRGEEDRGFAGTEKGLEGTFPV